jgi:hypothetical protein
MTEPAPGTPDAATAAIEELQTMLSFDRPVSQEKMVAQARDLLLYRGFPVSNDFRPTPLQHPLK